jgi:hypothetical protein
MQMIYLVEIVSVLTSPPSLDVLGKDISWHMEDTGSAAATDGAVKWLAGAHELRHGRRRAGGLGAGHGGVRRRVLILRPPGRPQQVRTPALLKPQVQDVLCLGGCHVTQPATLWQCPNHHADLSGSRRQPKVEWSPCRPPPAAPLLRDGSTKSAFSSVDIDTAAPGSQGSPPRRPLLLPRYAQQPPLQPAYSEEAPGCGSTRPSPPPSPPGGVPQVGTPYI